MKRRRHPHGTPKEWDREDGRDPADKYADKYGDFEQLLEHLKLVIAERQAEQRSQEQLHDDLGNYDDGDETGEAHKTDPELVSALQACIRNTLKDKERLVLEVLYTRSQAIEGACVRRGFSYRGNRMEPGQYLMADEVLGIKPANRRAGFLKIHRSRTGTGTMDDAVTLAKIAKEVGLANPARVLEVHKGALRKLRKHLFRLKD
jgi:DNA-directed RNA polymerase specialized sigma subunit